MRRSGFTLVELMLVMVVIVIVGSLAFPAFEAMLATSKEYAARDMVRSRWAEMRAHAMAEGRAYRFAVTENTGKFRVAPDDDAYWLGSGAAEGEKVLIVTGELPEGILFTTSEAAFAGVETAPAPGPEWGLAIAIYLGDGTARDDARVFFGKAGQRALGLRLRALTGAVSAIEAGSVQMEEAP